MESSDEHATGHLIAERTLAVVPESEADLQAGDQQSRSLLARRAGLLMAGTVSLFLLVLGLRYLGLGGHPGRGPSDQSASTSGASAGQPGAGGTGAGQGPVGSLNCNAWPPAKVYLEGRLLGTTPLRGVQVPAGPHVLLFTSKDGTSRKEVPIVVTPSETRTLAVSLD